MKRKAIILISIFIFLSFIPLMSTSQISLGNIPFTANVIYTSPLSISSHIFYLCIEVNGYVSLTNLNSLNFTVTSISSYISGLNAPELPLNGMPISPPKVVNNTVYFIYLPGVSSISKLNITSDYFAYANYTNGEWSSVKNILTSGITEDFAIYGKKIYVVWKPYAQGSSYLLTLSLSGNIINNISLDIINASLIQVINNQIGIISNVSLSYLNFSLSLTKTLSGKYFVVNLSTGNIIQTIPSYQGMNPTYVSSSLNNPIILISYTSSTQSFLATYNVSSGKIVTVESFPEDAIGYINGKFILVETISTQGDIFSENIIVYNTSWSEIYEKSISSLTSFLIADGIFLNSSSVTVLVTHLSMQISFQQIIVISNLQLLTVLRAPQPFTILWNENKYDGYTILNIYWNEKVPSHYIIYINDSLYKITSTPYIVLNITHNETLVVTVIAYNQLGNISDSLSINVVVLNSSISTIYPTSTINSLSSSFTSTTQTSSTTSTSQTTNHTTSSSSSTLINSNIVASSTPSLSLSGNTIIVLLMIIVGATILVLVTRKI